MSAIHFSYEESVLLVRFPNRKMVAADLTTFTTYLQDLWHRQENFIWIIDVRSSPLQDPLLQYKAAMWAKQNKASFQNFCWGTAYVINDSITRRIIQFFLNTLGADSVIGPVAFFENTEEALTWTKQLLKKHR